MPKTRKVPAYVHHKPSGQARVRIDGRDIYLGKYDAPESHQAYDDAIAEWLAESEAKSTSTKATTLNAVLAAWCTECKLRYSSQAGRIKERSDDAPASRHFGHRNPMPDLRYA